MKEYRHIKDNSHLKIEVYYSLGGMNYFTGTIERRGYYLSVSPVERSSPESGFMSESYTAFSGNKILLLETKRKSDKAYEKAVELSKDEVEKLVHIVMTKNNLKFKEHDLY